MAPEANTNIARTWGFPSKLFGDQFALAALTAVGLFFVIALITLGIDRFETLDMSVWSEAASQVPRFFVLFIGIHIAMSVLPLHVAHGRTRRDFAIEGAIFAVCYSAGVALLVVAGFGLEALLFRLIDAPQTIPDGHFFSSAGEVHLIFLEHFLMFLGWTLGGTFLGAAFYRFDSNGLFAILLVLLPAVMLDVAIGAKDGPIGGMLNRVVEVGTPVFGVSILMSLAAAAILLAASWPVVRDIPLRGKAG